MPIAIAGLSNVLLPLKFPLPALSGASARAPANAPAAPPTKASPGLVRQPRGNALQAAAIASETSSRFALTLQTQEGDTVTMTLQRHDSFTAIDVRSDTRDLQLRLQQLAQASSEGATLSVTGELSDAESQAIAKVLGEVVAAAESFYLGDSGAALSKLTAMNLDADTLLELSLTMSVHERVEYQRVGLGPSAGAAAQLKRLAAADQAVGKLLDGMARQQRRLLSQAQHQFEPASAIRLVQGLLPPVMNQLATTPVGTAH